VRRAVWNILVVLSAAGVLFAVAVALVSWRQQAGMTPRRAVREAEAALRQDPALLEAETRQAVRLGAALSIRARLRTAEALFIQGVQFEREGDLRRAEDRYWDATDQRQDYAPAWLALGLLLGRKGGAERLEQAERILAWAVSLEPEWSRARSAHAIVLRKMGRLTEAAAEAREAVALDPEDPAARNNLGNVLLALGDPDGAAAAYQSAMDLDPDQAMPRYNLACLRARQGRVEDALELLDGAFRLDGSLREGAPADPDLAPLLDHPAFRALLEGYNLAWFREHGTVEPGGSGSMSPSESAGSISPEAGPAGRSAPEPGSSASGTPDR